VQNLETPADRRTRNHAGNRSYTRTERKRGRYIQARPARNRPRDIAFDATIRAAAPFQKHRGKADVAFAIERGDIQEKVRVRRSANLILFTLDASWSMSAVQRMEATKGAILSLLTDAYQRRDRVGLVVFRGTKARLALPPTSSVDLARKTLVDLPVGGKTPLAAGLILSHQILLRYKRTHPELKPMMILLTDAAGNVSVSSLSPDEEAHRMAQKFRSDGIRSVVINMEDPVLDSGLARALAAELGAPCHTFATLKAHNLYRAVKRELQ